MDKKITIHLAKTEQDLRDVYYVRSEVFGKEQGYSRQDLVLGNKPNEYHVLCKIGGVPIAAATCEIGNAPGDILLEQYFDFQSYYREYGTLMFYSRYAIIPKYRGTTVALALYYFLWLFAKHCNCGLVLNASKKENAPLIKVMLKLGFRKAGECINGILGEALVWKAEPRDFIYDLDVQKYRILNGIMPRIEMPNILRNVS